MTFPRLHLFEFEDQVSFLGIVRDLATDYLCFIQATFRLHRPMLPLVAEALRVTNQQQIVDLCSGGGGPVLEIQKALSARWSRVVLTYVLPLIPLMCWWDGVVSHCRAYTLDELQALTKDLGASYEWRVDRIRLPYSPAYLTYLLGFRR